MPFSQLAEILLYVMPGFVALKCVYLFGIRQRRTDLEWVIWSIAFSTVVFIALTPLRSWLKLDERDPLAIGLAYPAAVVIAGLLLVLLRRPVVKRQLWRFIAEPWDMAYSEALARRLQAVVELQDGREVYGDILWMGLAGEGSARSVTIGSVQMSDGAGTWVALPPDHELHIPEGSIRVLRLIPFTQGG